MVYWYIAIPWLILVGLTAYLMVSTWRFWSAKEINLSRSHPFRLLLLLALIAYIVLRYSNVGFVPGRAGVHVLGDLGARGLWVVSAAAAEGRPILSRAPTDRNRWATTPIDCA